jgi:chromosome transmission fidelity protein 18
MHGNTLYGEQRPNCIILDEIDGIDGRASIDALITIIKAPLKSAVATSGGGKNTSGRGGQKGDKSGDRGDHDGGAERGDKGGRGSKMSSNGLALTRPLICVCNDQFAPALRELRKVRLLSTHIA